MILDGATDYAIVTLDSAGCVTAQKEGARRVLGYEEAEILERFAKVWFLPEDRAAGVPRLKMCRAQEQGRAENERWHLRKDGTRFWASGLTMPLPNVEGQPQGFMNILRDNPGRRAEDKHRTLWIDALSHRVRNTLATVQSIAGQTVRSTGAPAAFQEAPGARLIALVRSHDMLTRSGWDGAPLREVAGEMLRPHEGMPVRVTVSCPAVRLAPNALVTLSLAFHELATNAAKYGALSVFKGCVE